MFNNHTTRLQNVNFRICNRYWDFDPVEILNSRNFDYRNFNCQDFGVGILTVKILNASRAIVILT